jgi:signal transduction histidine kinase
MKRENLIMTVVTARPASSAFARVLRAPFTRRSWAQLAYAFANVPLAIAGFAFTVGTLVAGAGVSLTMAGLVIGPPLVAVSTFGARGLGSASRGLARRLLGERVPPPPPLRPVPGGVGWLRSALSDAPGWRARGYLLLKLPVSLLGLLAAAYFWLGGLVYLTFPLWWEVFHRIPIRIDGVSHPDPVTSPGPIENLHVLTLRGSFLLIPVGAAALLAAPWVTCAAVSIDRSLIRRMLGSASLAERVHDLEQTRAHAVDDSAARLRSIERDLHDGAQAQLVGLAMKLGLAKEKLGVGMAGAAAAADLDRAAELVDAAHRGAIEAITELRVLARGIHPPVLDNGLADALTTLAARSAVPVELITDIRSRPSAAIETIAYFCAAELLANVAKHSGARRATVEAVHVPGLLRLRVTDDGAGGARPDAGGGLTGLADRIRTVDGRMEISSPRGGPTVVTVELPSQA